MASELVEAEEAAAEAGDGAFFPEGDGGCRGGLQTALTVLARPLAHTARGLWAARMAFMLAGRECWPTFGQVAESWPVSYGHILQVALDAEALHEPGPAAEFGRPRRWPMPPPIQRTKGSTRYSSEAERLRRAG
ncbi:unnamed protein product [Prorocentrum cordatum]|uniref:Uncharacterized protein n=1 Tax=Prorocentrum cordatum TaxID=2364126 RepID=A0ABN9S2K0_9DINO|nr:unnamed protein product [Polarella glacialis]